MKTVSGANPKKFDDEGTCSILEHTAATRTYATRCVKPDAIVAKDITKRRRCTSSAVEIDDKRNVHFLHTPHWGKPIADHTLVALTVMIAESRPAERELMVNLVMTFPAEDDHA